MSKLRFYRPRLALAGMLVAVLAACASAPARNAALDEARAAYDKAAADSTVVRSAPVELGRAQQALQRADSALRAGDPPLAVEHYAYLARQRTEVAVQAGKVAEAERAVAAASQGRDSILISARTREAETQRGVADKARMDAEAARKVAEDRLAALQASKTQTDSARARAKSLEEQLASLKAKQTSRGMVLTLGDVLFDTGRAELNPGAYGTLDSLANFLKENPERRIMIEGYTDSVGSSALNLALSERRADAVKTALSVRGIAADRVSARGFGKANPVASNATAAGRQQNRRVEIVFSGTS